MLQHKHKRKPSLKAFLTSKISASNFFSSFLRNNRWSLKTINLPKWEVILILSKNGLKLNIFWSQSLLLIMTELSFPLAVSPLKHTWIVCSWATYSVFRSISKIYPLNHKVIKLGHFYQNFTLISIVVFAVLCLAIQLSVSDKTPAYQTAAPTRSNVCLWLRFCSFLAFWFARIAQTTQFYRNHLIADHHTRM